MSKSSITIKRDSLVQALKTAETVVDKRNTIPVLGGVRIVRTKIGAISVTSLVATDLDRYWFIPLDTKGKTAFDTVVPLQRLKKLVDNTEGDVTIDCVVEVGERHRYGGKPKEMESYELHHLMVTADDTVLKIEGYPPTDWPTDKEVEYPFVFKISAELWHRGMSKVRPAMSDVEARYYLNGIYLENKDCLKMVATDGHTLSAYDLARIDVSPIMPSVIVPRDTVYTLLKTVDPNSDRDITVEVCSDRMRFTIDDDQLVTQLIDGTFPDYKRVVPKEGFQHHVVVDREAFRAKVLRTAGIGAVNGKKTVKLAATEGEIKITIDHGEGVAVATMPATLTQTAADITGPLPFTPGIIEWGANYSNIDKLFQLLESDEVSIDLIDARSPYRLSGADDPGHLVIAMPMRV
jgi:DNA polymerase III subunit beta